MNSDLQSLYRETLLKHSREPRGRLALDNADRIQEIKNPLCGDVVTLFLTLERDRIEKARFQSQSCSICTASSSMLADRVSDANIKEALKLADELIAYLKNKDRARPPQLDEELDALSGVRSFPSRIRCATLPWEALALALRV